MCKIYTKGDIMKKSIVINLIGGPGAGKSTMASLLFAKMKIAGISCELVTEYAKDMVWENRYNILNDQLYILSKQYRKMRRVNGVVDVIITDSPIINNIYYNSKINDSRDKISDKLINDLVFELSDKFENYYYLIERNHSYETKGRYQTEEESNMVSKEIEDMLNRLNISHKKLKSGKDSVNKILEDIQEIINDNENMFSCS